MDTGTIPAVGNELFLHNMRALWRHDPALALQVDAVDDELRFPLEPARRGAWTARASTAAGPTYLHSRHDPEAEAERFASTVEIEGKYCVVVSGMGLGYHLRAIFARLRGDALLICCEPSMPLIATALSCVDLTELLTSGRFLILPDNDKARLHEKLKPHGALIMLGTQFVRHAPSVRLDETGHAAIAQVITEYVTFQRMTLMTLVANSRITCRNVAMNLATYVSTPPIDILRNRFAGDPAIVISAGPSLSRNIEQLREWKGRAVLCAVQTVLQPLARRGIVPDFATSLDYHEMSRKFFEGVDFLDKVHLVAEPKATWHVVDGYPGPVSLLENSWAKLLVGEALGARGGLPAGATVAHLAFYLAVYMGCDPIIFVGQDLAYTGHVHYVPGVEIHRQWRGEMNRFNTMEQKEWDRIARNRSILLKVPGNDGTDLFTDELLFTYLEQFEKDIASVAARVINATEGGARIRGTEVMSLRQAMDRYGGRRIDPARFAYRESTCWHDPSRAAAAVAELEKRLQELDEAVRVCDELLDLLDELSGMTGAPARFNQRLIRVDELRAAVHQESRPYQIVNGVAQLSELRRFSADRRISAAGDEPVERAKSQIARDKEFIGGVRSGAIDVKPLLADALARLRQAAPS